MATHLTESQIAGYLDGGLSSIERTGVEQHLDQCDACRAELAEVEALSRPATSGGTSRRRRTVWVIGGALAAGLAAIVLVRMPPPSGPANQVERPSLSPGEALPRLRIVTPLEGDVTTTGQLRLTWRPLPAGTYHVALLAEDGAPLWTVDTADTSVTLPPAIRLEAGRTYFWRVDAVHDGVAATSGVIPFTAGPP